MPQATIRHCFALDLKDSPELIAAYCQAHAPGAVPVAVTQSIRDNGVAALEIWLCGNRMFMIMETTADFDAVRNAEHDAANPDVQAWEETMWRFQQALPFALQGQKWVPMSRIYGLDEQ